MEKFDQVMDKMRDAVNTAGKKAGEFVEVSKYKLRAASINNEIERIYKRLGVVVYESRKSNTNSDALVESCIAEIDGLIQELREIQGKIDGIRTASKCRACGFENVEEAQYCASCGAPLRGGQKARAGQASAPQPQEPTAEAAPQEATDDLLGGQEE